MNDFEWFGRDAWIGIGKVLTWGAGLMLTLVTILFLWDRFPWTGILFKGLGITFMTIIGLILLAVVIAMIWSVIAPIIRWWKRRHEPHE